MKRCEPCGLDYADEKRFCRKCGKPLTLLSELPQETTAEAPQAQEVTAEPLGPTVAEKPPIASTAPSVHPVPSPASAYSPAAPPAAVAASLPVQPPAQRAVAAPAPTLPSKPESASASPARESSQASNDGPPSWATPYGERPAGTPVVATPPGKPKLGRPWLWAVLGLIGVLGALAVVLFVVPGLAKRPAQDVVQAPEASAPTPVQPPSPAAVVNPPQPAPKDPPTAPAVATNTPSPYQAAPSPPPAPPPPPLPTPPPSAAVDDSGFPAGTWAVGNRWIFDVQRRSTRAVADEAAALHYRSFWSIASSSLSPSGRRVTLVEEGGDLRGVKRIVFVESGCVRFDKAKDRSFCLSDGRATQLSVLGSRYDGVVVSNGKREFSVAPDIGVVRIVGEGDRLETETTLELVGFQVGGRAGGDTSLTPMTCDWYISKRKAQKIRLIESSDPISGAVSRFLGAPTGRIDVDMTNRHGAAGATAVTDDTGSVLRIDGLTGPLGDGVRLRGKLRALKGFESLDGTTDYLMVTTMDDREMIMHILPIRNGRISGDLHISAMVLDPKMDYSETFLTNDGPDGCKLQVVVGDHRDKSYLAADYPFAGDSLRRAGGSLSIQTNSWRNTSSLQQ